MLQKLGNEIIGKIPVFRTESMGFVCNLGDVESKHQIRAYLVDGSKRKSHVAFNFIVQYNGEGFIGYLEYDSEFITIFNCSMEHITEKDVIEEILNRCIQKALVEFAKS